MNKKINIVSYISEGHASASTESDLSRWTGLSTRAVRIAISKARRETVILNMQDGKGYFLPSKDGDEDYLVDEWIRQEENRLKQHALALRGARNFVKGVKI